MATTRRTKKLQAGDRVTDKITGRDGTVDQVIETVSSRELGVAYDEAPQDAFLTTPATQGAQRPEALFERKR